MSIPSLPPRHTMQGFPTMFSGTISKNNEELLSREEQVRVCNSVQNQLDKHKRKPKYAAKTA